MTAPADIGVPLQPWKCWACGRTLGPWTSFQMYPVWDGAYRATLTPPHIQCACGQRHVIAAALADAGDETP